MAQRHPRLIRCFRAASRAAAAVLVSLLMLAVLAVDTGPAIVGSPSPPARYLSQTRELIKNTVRSPATEIGQKTLILTEADLSAAANFLMLRKKLNGHARCRIEGSRLWLNGSLRLADRPFGLYLNFAVTGRDDSSRATVTQLRVGQLTIPSSAAGLLMTLATRFSATGPYLRIGQQMVSGVRIRDGHLDVRLNWSRDMLKEAEGMITDLADKERLLAYHDKLAEVVGQPTLRRFVKLGVLMQPLFDLAKQRSAENGDPVAENRALLLILGAYVNGKRLALGLPPAAAPAQRGVLLNRRVDTAQHFTTSATLAMAGQRALADMIGLAKELNDTHHGSGFSFVDLAADQAGAFFGRSAVRSPDKARRIQELVSRSPDESQFMPVVDDLPERLSPEEFAKRFENVESPAFQAMKNQIQARILARPVYQP